MELLQREFQNQILRVLSEQYPATVDLGAAGLDKDGRQLAYNLAYLEEHRLITAIWTHPLSGDPFAGMARITAAGIDFISDDGGLSAILGVVTVKLHEDTIKSLLIEKVESSSANGSVRAKLIEQIKSLPAAATKELTMAAIKRGVADMPDFIHWLHHFVSSAV